jgi:S-formylglutathione hydrolase FrmB
MTVTRAMARACGLLALAALCSPAAASTAASPASFGGARIVQERPLPDNGVELTIATAAFSAPTRVEVYLPAGYEADPSRRWPVTYYLHGAQGDQARFHAWYGDLIKNFPSIVVSPDGGWVGFYSDWYNRGAGGPPMYETYDIDQLIPLIDARFRTTASRAGRAVIGESMGGYGVMTYAARHPDLFAAAASLSGAVDSNYLPIAGLISFGPPLQGGLPDSIYGPRATDEVRWHGHNPTDLADNLRDVALQVRTAEGIPTTIIENGAPDSAVGCTTEAGVYQASVDFHQQLLALGVPHFWKDYGAGCHSLPNFRREFADALPGLEAAFANPRPAPKAFDYRSIEPRLTIWNWSIEADPARALEFMQMRHAGRRGLRLVGSGTSKVTTPPFFQGWSAVAVITDGVKRVVVPDSDGRLHFRVDLGAAHPNQQYGAAAALAGDGKPGYFTSRTVRFARG